MRVHSIIRSIYAETFEIVKAGGCFLNLDRMTPSVAEQLKWLRGAGFAEVQRFWDGGKRAIGGGFRKPRKRSCLIRMPRLYSSSLAMTASERYHFFNGRPSA